MIIWPLDYHYSQLPVTRCFYNQCPEYVAVSYRPSAPEFERFMCGGHLLRQRPMRR